MGTIKVTLGDVAFEYTESLGHLLATPGVLTVVKKRALRKVLYEE